MENLREKAINLAALIVKWFVSTVFIMWGWNTLAPHINCPTFGYWEVFAMRMGFSYLTNIIGSNFSKEKDK